MLLKVNELEKQIQNIIKIYQFKKISNDNI